MKRPLFFLLLSGLSACAVYEPAPPPVYAAPVYYGGPYYGPPPVALSFGYRYGGYGRWR